MKSPHMSVLGCVAGTGDPKSKRGAGSKEGRSINEDHFLKKDIFGRESDKR